MQYLEQKNFDLCSMLGLRYWREDGFGQEGIFAHVKQLRNMDK
jgi:hypothetical protein